MTALPSLGVILVHHASALGPKEDAMQPLSGPGRAWADEAALEAARLGARPSAIWHSGKLRARQTAEAFWRACNPLATLGAQRGMLPGDPPQWIADRLLVEEGELLLAGHMPQLARLLRLLVVGDADAPAPDFPAHGVIALERRDRRYVELWRIVPRSVGQD
jgi:phosphohistidine phosphatase